MSGLLFRFDKPRKSQEQLWKDVGLAVETGRHLIAHAPTGLGKTDASLGAALKYALDNGKTIFFLTPKISQHTIALDVLRGLAKKYDLNLRVTDMVGRKYMCVDPVLSSADFDGFYEICSRRRKKETCPYYINAGGFTKKQREDSDRYLREVIDKIPPIADHRTIWELCFNFRADGLVKPLCAYEVATEIAKISQVVIADYYHILSPEIRKIFLARLNKSLQDSILIIDESHNLPDRIRALLSASLSVRTLELAIKELDALNQLELSEKLKAVETELYSVLHIDSLKNGEEVRIKKYDILDVFGRIFGDIEDFTGRLLDLGDEYIEHFKKTKSAAVSLAKFLKTWDGEDESHVRIVKRWTSGNGFTILYKALDPALATQFVFKEAHSVILMSGTLTPPAMYRDILGAPAERTILKEYVSPFPQNNRLNLIVPTVTTKYTSRNVEEYKKIAEEIAKIVNSNSGNVAVFFPSYKVLSSVHSFITSIKKPILVQKENMRPSEMNNLLQQFRNYGNNFGAVLFAVAGGSIAEGLDFPGNELTGVIVVGIPLQEMNLETRALIDYYRDKFGNGWKYGYIYPAMIKAIQAAGRCIRNETDKGVVVFLDTRYTWSNYSSCFPKDMNIIETKEPERYIKEFWGN